MCKVFAEQDPQGYRQINRSVRIGGHSTSIQLEATFWKLLDEIAESQNMTTPRFISTLYDEASAGARRNSEFCLDASHHMRALSCAACRPARKQ